MVNDETVIPYIISYTGTRKRIYVSGLFTGRDPIRGSGQEVFKNIRVGSGRVRRYSKSHGSGRVRLGGVS